MTLKEAATMVGKSTRWVQLRVTEGYLQKTDRGRYVISDFVQGVVAYYEGLAEKSNQKAAATRSSDARTREIELRIAERERRLIPIEDASAVVADLAGLVLAELTGLPARITRDLDQRKEIEKATDDLVRRIKERASQRADALRSSGVDLDQG
ncbi:hypothetical protein [Loktanella sp. 3ANDIMAR09]|uniref:hypothetical protein n=1 Tax=Loktanella sp. 3ANDIMAR09 TaxID=1225657 RepID=UPI0012EE73BF|nr:hypothetical protein [Loktanella sp. 3ANDIMAR09]